MGPECIASEPNSSSDSGSQSGLAAHPSRSDKIYGHMFPRSWGFTWSLVSGLSKSLNPHQAKMSPIGHAGAGAASKDVKRESATARLLGSGKTKIGLLKTA